MKKNLLALVVVLLVIAVAAQFHKDPARSALESDLRVSLERLWGTTGHQVEAISAKGGTLVRVQVDLPKQQGIAAWNDPFVRFVVARHPKIPISGLEINPVVSPSSTPRIELMRRQTQALVDGTLGAGHGLILLEGKEEVPPVPQVDSSIQEKEMKTEMAPSESAPAGAAPRMRSNSIVAAPTPVAEPTITHECLVLAVELGDQEIRQLQAQIQSQVPCSQFRVVRLPSI